MMLSKVELDAMYCKSGSRHELYKIELLSFNSVRKCELKLIDGSITVNADDVIKKSAQLTFLHDDRIDYLNDRCKIYMGIHIGNNIKWYPLGVFIFVKPQVSQGICKCTMHDETSYIKQDRLVEPKLFTKGTNYVDVLSYFLTSCNITKINIESTTHTLTSDVVCDHSKNKLEWFNYFADQINFTHLITDADGWFVSKKYNEPTPSGITNTYESGKLSIIKKDISKVSDAWNVPNVFVRLVSNPKLPPMVSTYVNNDPNSRFSVGRRHGKKIVDFSTIDNVASQQELDNITRKLAFNSVQIEESVEFSTLNMPTHSYNDIIELKHDETNGIFVEHSYSIDLVAGGEMHHVCKRLVNLYE